MRNYISVNAKYYKMIEIDRISNHNFRQSKVDYLLPKEAIKFENKNIVFDENFKATKQDLSLQDLDFTMRGQFAKLLQMKKNILKKNNAKRRKNENEVIEMVVALSEEQALNYLEKGQDLMQGFENFAKNIEAKYGLKPLAISLHLDEGHIENGVEKLNIHAHATFFNYDFEKEKSVLRTLQKRDFQLMQDIAANSFQEVGLDFRRGEAKEITNKKHLERNDFILAKQEQELKQQRLETSKLKNEEKELLKTLEKGTIEHDETFKRVGVLQQQEQDLRAQERELKAKIKELSLNTPKDVKKVTTDLTHNLVNKHIEKNLLGNKVINNVDGLKKDVYKELNNAQNTKLVLQENEDLKRENEQLKQDIAFKDKEIAQKDTKINNLTQTTQKLEKAFMINYEQLQAIKRDFKTKVANQVRRLNLFNRLKRSNIASKIRNRLSKELDSNSNLYQRER